jgi:hypothetical protein
MQGHDHGASTVVADTADGPTGCGRAPVRDAAHDRAAQSAQADFVPFQPRFQPPGTGAGRSAPIPPLPPVHPFTRSPVHPFTRPLVPRSPRHVTTIVAFIPGCGVQWNGNDPAASKLR